MESMIRNVRVSVTALAVGALIALNASASFAQSSGYSSDWRNPDSSQAQAGDTQVQGLVDELNKLVDNATTAGAAHPNFLRDLRDLARRFDWPWRKRVLFDDFTDGNVSANPVWKVGGAPVTVDRYDGVRFRVSMEAPQTAAQTQRFSEPEDIAVQILGAFLKQRSSSETRQQAPATKRQEESILVTSAATANQFALQADIVFVNAVNGYIEMGVIQGTDGLGYRVAIRPRARDAAVEILRIGSRGGSVVNSARVAAATWGAQPATQPKTVLFTRDDAGNMNVSIDGTVVLTANDRAFRDGFDGFIVRNGGGDYILKSIAGYSK
ncbi:MAG: hypothetical protein E2O36_01465 [Proteobacteria bacterium]|nr:MAG: hypothetical protein E2O36_01465 [Pseudomonadota bacterium]